MNRLREYFCSNAFHYMLPVILFWTLRAWAIEADSSAMVLLDEIDLTVQDEQHAEYTVRRVIRINSAQADHYARGKITTDRYSQCRDLTGQVRNIAGKSLKKLHNKEIQKVQAAEGFNFYDESRHLLFDLAWPEHPYVVEYQYTLDLKTLLYWPNWHPQEKVAVQKSTYRLLLKKPVAYHTLALGLDVQPIEQGNILIWSKENIAGREMEDDMPPEAYENMSLLFSPDAFTIEQFTADMKTWTGLAQWHLDLNKEKAVLNTSGKTLVQELIKNVSTQREKTEILYSYLQQHTRYVAIEPGLSGWQPHQANDVLSNKYGDCKDLANLMAAMLQEAGIPAFLCLVKTRDQGVVYPEFPANQFNHVVCLAVADQDSFWLDGTVDRMPLGIIPKMNEGTLTLIAAAEKPRLVHIPESTAEQNSTVTSITAELSQNGALSMNGEIRYSGLTAYERRSHMADLTPEKQAIWISSQLLGRYGADVQLHRYDLINLDGPYHLPFIITFQANIKKFAALAGLRLMIRPALMHRILPSAVAEKTTRRYPIFYDYAYSNKDTLFVKLPHGYSLEAGPEQISVQTSFGIYQTTHRSQEQTFFFSRHFAVLQRNIPAADYADYRDLLKTAAKNDRNQFIFSQAP